MKRLRLMEMIVLASLLHGSGCGCDGGAPTAAPTTQADPEKMTPEEKIEWAKKQGEKHGKSR